MSDIIYERPLIKLVNHYIDALIHRLFISMATTKEQLLTKEADLSTPFAENPVNVRGYFSTPNYVKLTIFSIHHIY